LTRHPQILDRNNSVLLIVDVQKKINAVQMQGELVIGSILKLIQTCKILNIPILITEQYPKGLGPTEPKILDALKDLNIVQKMSFSCCGSDQWMNQLRNLTRQQIVLTGIETHVCVQQTALDLLEMGFQVHLPKDAVSSRKRLDYETSLQRMSLAGAILTTIESVLFELLEEAGTPEFKQISNLIK